MKTIILGALSALAFSTALGVASAQTVQPAQGSTILVDCMQRDGGQSGCSSPYGDMTAPYASFFGRVTARSLSSSTASSVALGDYRCVLGDYRCVRG